MSSYSFFQSRLVSYNIILDRHEESPNQYSHYQEKLSRRPLGPGVLALPEDHPQRYQAKQPSQVFGILIGSSTVQAYLYQLPWRWMEVAPTSYSAAKNADNF